MKDLILDDLNKISKIDEYDQIGKLENLSNQILESFDIVDSYEFEKIFKINNIIFNGMGGSAISGDIIKSLLINKLNIPIFVNRGYSIPKWANKNTLVINQSYSGDTEETLSAFKIAYQKKCKLISISSGGRLQEFSENRGITNIKIPNGYIPRSAIAYFIFISLNVLNKIGVTNNILKINIDDIIEITNYVIKNNNKNNLLENNPSKKLAKKIYNNIPQIYGWDIYAPIAKRWCTQFNENSKVISKYNIVSESNHNDIVGWSQDNEISNKFSCIIFRDKTLETIYMRTRLDFMKNLFLNVAGNVIEVNIKGKDPLSKIIYSISLGDFTSCYLALLRNIDPTPVKIIDELKRRLKSI